MINGFRLAGNQWAASGRDPIPLSDAFAVMISVSPVPSVATPTVHKSAQSGQSVDPYLFIVCYSSKSIPQGFEQVPAAAGSFSFPEFRPI